MTPETGESISVALSLLPHQASLVDSVLDPTSKQITVLRGQAGLGKGTALVALAGRLLAEQPTARVLLFAPAALRGQFLDRLSQQNTKSVIVDRYYYRELLDAAESVADFWPIGMVLIVSPQFARQTDVRASLGSVRWDLVIADEAHSFKGANAEVLRNVSASAERVVFSTVPLIELPEWLPSDRITVIEWQWETLVDRAGTPFPSPLRPVLNEVYYQRSPAESNLAEIVAKFADAPKDSATENWFGGVLRRSFQSSPAALDGMLARLQANGQPRWASPDEPETGDDDSEYGTTGSSPLLSTGLATALEHVQQGIEDVHEDTKLAALSRLLVSLHGVAGASVRICVVADYTATLFYIAAEMENQGLPCLLFSGRLSPDARAESVRRFLSDGGILVASRSLMTAGLDAKGITDLVLFDIPESNEAVHRVLGRVDRFGRTSQVTVHALLPSDVSTVRTHSGLEALRAAIEGQASPPR